MQDGWGDANHIALDIYFSICNAINNFHYVKGWDA